LAIILSIESSGNICSVALHQNGNLLAFIESDEPNIHGQKLALFIKEMCDLQKINIHELNAIAVSEGPGSYTGLRIGVSLAKGLCYASNVPLLAVDTLQSLAFSMLNQNKENFPSNAQLFPMIDARRMEVYLAGFDLHLNKIMATKPVILNNDFFNSIHLPTYFGGNGALKIDASFYNLTHLNYIPDISFSAKHLGSLAFQKFKNKELVDIAYFEPVYLKEFATIIK
jgi:tRNA threonylcarbamoyladenosine biosynthesis protein TsaB